MGITYFRPELDNAQYVSLQTLPLKTQSAHTLNLQSLKSARAYCCAIGMQLASFPNKARLQDAFDAVKYR
jgi:hypothetical protein